MRKEKLQGIMIRSKVKWREKKPTRCLFIVPQSTDIQSFAQDTPGTSEIEHGLCAFRVDNPLAKARGLSLRTGAQTMLYLSRLQSRPYVNKTIPKLKRKTDQ